MTKRKKYIILALGLLLLGAEESRAQQDAMFGQFQYNMLELNPAYAGYRETTNITAIHRSQWVGFDGAPVTQTISFNKPTKADEFAFGGAISNDHIGPTNSLQVSGDFAYRIRFRQSRKERTMLSFGLKSSLNYYQADLANVNLIEDNDETFFRNESGVLLPNFSFGTMLSGKTYFIGLSVKKLLPNNKLVNSGNELYDVMQGKEEKSFYMTGGKIWKLNRELKIYPALLFKAQRGAPVSGGAFLNFLIMSDFKIGGYYHFKEVAGALVQWQINRKFRVGYTFELPVTSLFGTNLGSHEIMLNYALKKGRTAIIYPKHF